MDYALLRQRMVSQQIAGRGIKNIRVLNALLKVERHKFLPHDIIDASYSDSPMPIGENQTISQPYIVALMTECLKLEGNEKILEIGTGSGYETAILAELAAQVYSIERIEKLAGNAKSLLTGLGYKNISIKVGDGTLGWQEEAPFDVVIITAASPQIPEPLLAQLKDPGKLILPLGGPSSQVLTLVEKKSGSVEYSNICGCVFVPLVGEYGFKTTKG